MSALSLAQASASSNAAPMGATPTPDDPALLNAWLLWQCQMITGTVRGELYPVAGGRMAPEPACVWPPDTPADPRLAALCQRVARERVRLVEQAAPAAEPAFDLLAHPVTVDGQLRAVVALVLQPRNDLQLRAVAQLLQWGLCWLETLLGHGLPASADQAEAPALLLALSEAPSLLDAATGLCDRVRAAAGCERVSLGRRQGLRSRLLACDSGTKWVPNSPLVQDLEAAMTEAGDHGGRLDHPAGDWAGRCHGELARRHGMARIATLPLTDGDTLCGHLVLESTRVDGLDEAVLGRLGALGPALGALLVAREARERSARSRAGRLQRALRRGRALALVACALLAVAAVVPGTQRVTAPAGIEGKVQRAIVAPVAGFIADAPARAGDEVAAGAVLARLEDRDLSLERAKWQAERDRHARMYADALARHQRADAGIARARMAEAEAELRLVDERLARATLRAPFAGIVARGDFSQLLGTPVERGQLLFEVAPLDDYRVIVEVDERDIGDVAPGHRGLLRLAGMPAAGLPLTVARIEPVASSGEGRNFFRVEASVDAREATLRPGMRGIAKLDVGRRALLAIWTQRLLDGLRLSLWRAGL